MLCPIRTIDFATPNTPYSVTTMSLTMQKNITTMALTDLSQSQAEPTSQVGRYPCVIRHQSRTPHPVSPAYVDVAHRVPGYRQSASAPLPPSAAQRAPVAER
jgi:hypothetical protein